MIDRDTLINKIKELRIDNIKSTDDLIINKTLDKVFEIVDQLSDDIKVKHRVPDNKQYTNYLNK